MIRYIILIVVSGIVGAVLAKNKGRDPFLWFFLCALVPLLVIAIALLPSKVAGGINKKCPYCSEIVKADARVCKHCGMGL